ncbi:hypothetical protein LCGC14_0620510 [marine sediment metagenome]|uniref:dATP/dGTP diphosphohydrolase N-terminal domain-containing protein n=1 Tax=marine sediment metagenome TaxID=412755 RepID=A0A0F9UDE7_9ZZZZ
MLNRFGLRDSGAREEFETGSVRDTEEGKPRFDLISPHGLKRLADLMTKGAEKYGERNWEKGQHVSRFYSSMFRHMMTWREGDPVEDHLAAILYNAMAIIHMEEEVLAGKLPKELLDLDIYDVDLTE